jgi:hypothetical protein
MESNDIEQQIPLANLTWRSALPISPSITISPISSSEILDIMTVGDREIVSLRLWSDGLTMFELLLHMIIDGMVTVAHRLQIHSELGAG